MEELRKKAAFPGSNDQNLALLSGITATFPNTFSNLSARWALKPFYFNEKNQE
jgi:hypothetical protein